MNQLKHSELTDIILKCFYDVYNELGNGFLEAVYQNALGMLLQENGLTIRMQHDLPVFFRGKHVGNYAADIIVDDKVILELKACRCLEPTHEAQLLHYLRATEIEVGLLLNFGNKPEFKRLVFDNRRKKPFSNPE